MAPVRIGGARPWSHKAGNLPSRSAFERPHRDGEHHVNQGVGPSLSDWRKTPMQIPPHDQPTASVSLLATLRRRWPVVLACVILAAASAAFVTSRQQKQYSAGADLLFRDAAQPDASVDGVLGLPSTPTAPDPTQAAATNATLVSLSAVADMTATALGNRVSAADVQSKVAVQQVGQSNVISVTATDPIPIQAAALANTYANEVVAFRRNVDRSVVNSAILGVQHQFSSLSPIKRSGPAGQALAGHLSQLKALAGSETGNVQIVQKASAPSSPSSPRMKLNIAAGAVLGLILGIALALLVHRLDRRVESPTELADAYRLPVLGVVPRTRELSLANRRGGQRLHLADARRPPGANGGSLHKQLVLPTSAADAFRAVRTRLRYAHPDRDLRSVLVTSANRGEGKSTVAWQLARVVAIQRNRSVLVLECDLRRPMLARAHGLRAAPGLVEVLGGNVPLSTAVQTLDPSTEEAHLDLVSLDELSLDPIEQRDPERKGTKDRYLSGPQMDVLVAGSPTSNPADLLDSDQMSTLLRDLPARYDFIVLDAPPGPLVSDTFPLVSQADGVIIVSSLRHASWDAFNTLRSQLELLDAPILGVVVNNAKRGAGEAYYPYHSDVTAGSNGLSGSGTGATPPIDEVRDVPPRRPHS